MEDVVRKKKYNSIWENSDRQLSSAQPSFTATLKEGAYSVDRSECDVYKERKGWHCVNLPNSSSNCDAIVFDHDVAGKTIVGRIFKSQFLEICLNKIPINYDVAQSLRTYECSNQIPIASCKQTLALLLRIISIQLISRPFWRSHEVKWLNIIFGWSGCRTVRPWQLIQ